MLRLILIGIDGRQVGAVELDREIKVVDLGALKSLGAVRARLCVAV